MTKKVKFTKDDFYSLIQKYSPSTLIAVVQEIAQATRTRAKINWKKLVKGTRTGITNPREYQMLWRHLAYRHPLEKIENDDEPLDDESDLEVELETDSILSEEEKREIAEMAKILLNSGLPRESAVANQITAENPSSHSSKIGTPTEGSSGSGAAGSSLVTKKKRKAWTEEEDIELIAAVDKFGEGNWGNILKGDFKCDRTASQLSQRWAIIQKRNNNHSASSNQSERLATQKAICLALDMPKSIKPSERLATQKAICLALDMPKSIKPSGIPAAARSSAVLATTTCEVLPVSAEPLSPLKHPASQSASQTKTSNKPPTALRKSTPLAISSPGTISSIKAAAFAAGGRIAAPSTAASLLKAAQSKKAVHIRPGSSIESFPSANKSCLLMTDEVNKCSNEAQQYSRLENTASVSEKTTNQ